MVCFITKLNLALLLGHSVEAIISRMSMLAGLVNGRFGSYCSWAVFLMQCGQATESRQTHVSSVREAVLFKMQSGKHVMTHTGEKPFPCEACGRRFIDREHWKRHFRVHSGERPFQCSICKKQFTDNSILKTHSRIHTTDKSYTCAACHKVFSTNWDLNKHYRIHTGEKPYSCKVCGKEYSRNDYLQKHSIIHTGKKSFGCEICNKNFTEGGTAASFTNSYWRKVIRLRGV